MNEPCVESAASVPPSRAGTWVAGIVFLGVASSAAALLALEHLAGLSLPGCGAGSPCARASESVWGKIPGLDWPVSHVGVAYFAGLLVAWLNRRRGLPTALRWLVRIGVLGSLGYTAVMFSGGYVCPYCLAVHAGNLAFWLVLEFGTGSGVRAARALAVPAGVFVLITAALGVAEGWGRSAARATAESQARTSGAAILAASTQPTSEAAAPAPASSPTTAAATGGFTGRYRMGPDAAPIRIMLFMDYQCKGCNLLEWEIIKLLEQHTDVSFSIKHWPANSQCNSYLDRPEHAYSCDGARAAEAVGLLGGNEIFWKFHVWLFKRSGRFAEDDLRDEARELGLDVAEFDRLRNGDLTLQLVQADVEEGFGLGIVSTPTIYINGIDFKGWSAPLAVTKLVDQLSEKHLPAKTAAADRPLPAAESFVFQWRQSKVRELPGVEPAWPHGPAEAKLKIVVWGDYQQRNTARADGIIRDFVAQRPDAQYTFHAYPLNPQCNAAVQEVQQPLACRAAQAAVAAGLLGGTEGYWRMHAWLLENQATFGDETLRSALPQLGFESEAFFGKMADPAIAQALAASAQAGKDLGLQNAPLMYLNGKLVPRWLHGGQPILRGTLEAAAAGN